MDHPKKDRKLLLCFSDLIVEIPFRNRHLIYAIKRSHSSRQIRERSIYAIEVSLLNDLSATKSFHPGRASLHVRPCIQISHIPDSRGRSLSYIHTMDPPFSANSKGRSTLSIYQAEKALPRRALLLGLGRPYCLDNRGSIVGRKQDAP